jgi:hypothetical protein
MRMRLRWYGIASKVLYVTYLVDHTDTSGKEQHKSKTFLYMKKAALVYEYGTIISVGHAYILLLISS